MSVFGISSWYLLNLHYLNLWQVLSAMQANFQLLPRDSAITGGLQLPFTQCQTPANIVSIKCHQSANVTKTEWSQKRKCHQNANVTKMQMSQKLKFHQTQMSPNRKCPKTQNSPILIYHKNWNLPNRSCTTRSPGLVHINPNGLPDHGLSDSRLAFVDDLHQLLDLLCLIHVLGFNQSAESPIPVYSK